MKSGYSWKSPTLVFAVKQMFGSHKHTAVSAAIFRLAVCVCEIMDKAGMCCRSVHYIISQLFSVPHL